MDTNSKEIQYIIKGVRDKIDELLKSSDMIEWIKSNDNYEYIIHVILHRKAFKKLEENTVYKGKYNRYHDVDKIGMSLFCDTHTVKRIHKIIAPHHNLYWINPDHDILVEKMLDWESCPYTKINSQKTAYEFMEWFDNDVKCHIIPVLEELGMMNHTNTNPLTLKRYNEMRNSVTSEEIISELEICREYLSSLLKE